MMRYTTTRSSDAAVEREVAKFLDENLYVPAAAKNGVAFRRISDAALQMRGVDVDFNGVGIDEKVKFKGCLNSILQYPSFELSFVNRAGGEQCGWFPNPYSLTDYYAFIAVFSRCGDESHVSADSIDKLNVLFVSKVDVAEHIRSTGSPVMEDAARLRSSAFIDRISYPHGDFHLKLSRQFSEAPVNLVYRRYVLEALPRTREMEVCRGSYRAVSSAR